MRSDLLLSFKSILKACQNYIDQSDIDHRDLFNKSKAERILDEVRDYFYSRQGEIKATFMKVTETDIE